MILFFLGFLEDVDFMSLMLFLNENEVIEVIKM